eukprot:6354321-Amphidinium_carterae.1
MSLGWSRQQRVVQKGCCQRNEVLRVRRAEGLLLQSLYGYLLHAWMSAFHPSQFIVIPNRYYESLATERVCQEIGDWFGIKVPCASALSGKVKNPSKHPALGHDIPAKLQKEFRALIAPDMSLLRLGFVEHRGRG